MVSRTHDGILFPMLLMMMLACTDNPKPTDGASWTGGAFQVYTHAAEDSCFDGAMEALFMPEGPKTPHAFAYPVYLPSFEELPLDYEIDLREPFVALPISMTQSADNQLLGQGEIDAVLLGESVYGDCTATMGVSLSVQPIDASTASGMATIDMMNLRGLEERCPVPMTDPCQVTLTLQALAE